MQNPQFGGTLILGSVDIVAANTGSDGNGTINLVLTGAGKLADVTFASGSSEITCANWSQISSTTLGVITNGDIVTLISSTVTPTGIATSTDYIIGNLRVSSDTAVFKLYHASTLALIAFSTNGTGPHLMRFPKGTRVDAVVIMNSQASPAASTANRCELFISNRNSSTWYPIGEVALPTLTRSASVVGQRQIFTQTGGIFLPEGARLGATIGVYSGAQDRTTVSAIQAANL